MKNKFEKLSLDTLRSIVEKEISRGETWRADNKKYFLFSSCEGEGLKKTGGATCFFFFLVLFSIHGCTKGEVVVEVSG
ncbi:hypothetical protein [Bacillus cereus]|uniref:hypothetical protein n=1 Tax=Bacillus cereus TaxID=1396 RepID=UPI000BED0AAF|nr:hypothetical protein [Bacillus cereus]PED41291.1 hypothetical protein CON26_25820 [Bacillus cereus]